VKIKIICVGKIKEKYIISGINEYSKRLSKYCNLDIIEVMDENFTQNPNSEEIEIIKTKEENKILKHINDKDYIISLALTGKQLTSEELADNINYLTITGYSTITFIIGGSYGLSRKYIKKIKHAFKLFKINIPTSII
jgi:ribosomal RNA large subunit methyltransferase H